MAAPASCSALRPKRRSGSRLCKTAVLQAGDPEQSWVVQSATRLPVHEFPVVGPDGRVFGEPFYAVMGFAATENGLGTMCRVSQKQVVNVAQRGGLAAVLEAEAPAELRIPKRSLGRSEALAQSLRAQISELRHLDQTIALLDWDEETMLPPAGARRTRRAARDARRLRHALLVSDRLGDLVEEVAAQSEGNERSRASLRCFGGCGAVRSRCPRIWCGSSPMPNRNRSALGRRRARRTTMKSSRRPSIGCLRSCANAPRPSAAQASPTTLCSTSTSPA